MGRFVEGRDRRQTALLPECLDDYVEADNPVRVIDAFVDGLDLFAIGFSGVRPASTGRPVYHPAMMLKLYVYGYLNQLCSSRRLEREAGRNVELMWLTGKLAPDFKTIADFRRDNAEPIKLACQQFIAVCRSLGLLAGSVVAIDGSKFRAINTHERNLRAPSSPGAWRRSRQTSCITWLHSTRATAPRQMRRRPQRSAWRTSSRPYASG